MKGLLLHVSQLRQFFLPLGGGLAQDSTSTVGSNSVLQGCDMPPWCKRAIRGSRQRGVPTRKQCVSGPASTRNLSCNPGTVGKYASSAQHPVVLPYGELVISLRTPTATQVYLRLMLRVPVFHTSNTEHYQPSTSAGVGDHTRRHISAKSQLTFSIPKFTALSVWPHTHKLLFASRSADQSLRSWAPHDASTRASPASNNVHTADPPTVSELKTIPFRLASSRGRWAAAAGEKGPTHVLAHGIRGPTSALFIALGGGSTPQNPPETGSWRDSGTVRSPMRRECTPEIAQSFSPEGLHRGPLLAAPRSCKP